MAHLPAPVLVPLPGADVAVVDTAVVHPLRPRDGTGVGTTAAAGVVVVAPTVARPTRGAIVEGDPIEVDGRGTDPHLPAMAVVTTAEGGADKVLLEGSNAELNSIHWQTVYVCTTSLNGNLTVVPRTDKHALLRALSLAKIVDSPVSFTVSVFGSTTGPRRKVDCLAVFRVLLATSK